MTTNTVTPNTDKRGLMMAVLVALRDLVDDFDDLKPAQRTAVIRAAAGFLDDLRAVGAIRGPLVASVTGPAVQGLTPAQHASVHAAAEHGAQAALAGGPCATCGTDRDEHTLSEHDWKAVQA